MEFQVKANGFSMDINPYHAELYIQDITCMMNCLEEISQKLAFFLFLHKLRKKKGFI
jgi:hypothetical protein